MAIATYSVILLIAMKPVCKRDGDFMLSAFPIVSIIDGPTIIRSELRYLGDRPITIRWNPVLRNAHVTMPNHPLAEIRVVASLPDDLKIDLKPGEALVEYECIHHWRVKLAAKGEDVRVKWYVNARLSQREKYIRVAEPELTFFLRPVPPSHGAIQAFSRNYFERVNSCRSLEQFERLKQARWIDSLSHADYVPLMVKALDSQVADSTNWLQNAILHVKCERQDLNALLYKELVKDRLSGVPVFGLWASKQLPQPSNEIVTGLLAAPNPWIRALASVTFPGAKSAKLPSEIVKDLNIAYAESRSVTVQRLVVQCRARSFDVREQATKELIALGEYAEVPLREEIDKGLTPEEESRVLRVLRDIDGISVRESTRAILAIESIRTHEASETLTLLARSHSRLGLSKLAREAIDRILKDK